VRAVVAALLLTFVGGSALAQSERPRPTTQPAPQGKKVKNLDFRTGDQITAGVELPSGEDVVGRKDVTQNSLIKWRVDFVREIVKSVE
jgi:hypothetical protein